MDNSTSTKMPKPFDTNDDLVQSTTDNPHPEQFQFHEDDRLKQEDDYRQGTFLFQSSCMHIFFVLELAKVQDEIVTLRQVLGAKLKRENELKTLLGVGFVEDLKQDWNETVHDIKSTSAYQKTAETLQAASDKITPVVQTVNTTLKSRLGSLKSKLEIFRLGFIFHLFFVNRFKLFQNI